MRLAARNWLLLAALSTLAITPAFGQRDLGTLLGTVTDSSGAVIPGAAVSISEDATGLEYALETNESGIFIRPALKPGSYSAAVEASGFKTSIQTGLIVTAGGRIQANFVLEVGAVTETIEVSATPPALQTETPTMGATLEARQTSELPLGGQRKFAFLARTIPGVNPGEPGARDAAGGAFSANGVRSNGQNNFLLNGVDNNVNVIDFINQTAYVVGPSVEAIGEMQVLTNGYNAEYGRAAGGVVNVTIKSGTNQVHGTLFEFLQNDSLNANRWEANRAGNERGPFKQNQFGAAIGGPLIKNRTFWFVDYQGTRIRDGGAASTLTIPTAAYAGGDFSAFLGNPLFNEDGLALLDSSGRQIIAGEIADPTTGRSGFNEQRQRNTLARDPFPNNTIPMAMQDPVARQIAAQFPLPNQEFTEPGDRPGNNFFKQRNRPQDVDQYDARVDHRISDKDNVFWSMSWSDEDKINEAPLPGDLGGGGFAGLEEENKAFNMMGSWTRVWNPTLISEMRFSSTRLNTRRLQANSDVNSFDTFGIPGFNPFGAAGERPNGGLPRIMIDGYGNNFGSAEWLPTQEFSRVWDFITNMSWNRGSHAIKFGFEYRPIGFPFFQVPSSRGRFRARRNHSNAFDSPGNTGDGFASLLLGYFGTGSRISTSNFIESERDAYSWYLQDDWKMTSKFTFNYGIRYELTSPIAEKQGRQSNWDNDSATLFIPEGPFQDDPLPPNIPTDFPLLNVDRGNVDYRLVGWDKYNIAPRIGFAYEAMEGTVLRAGYGIFYGAEENEGGSPNRGEGAPFNQTVDFTIDGEFGSFNLPQEGGSPLNRLSDGFTDNPFSLPAPIALRGLQLNHDQPLVHKWNMNIQRDLGFSTILEVGYIGSRGQKLKTNWSPNAAVFSPVQGAPQGPRRVNPWLNTGTSQTAAFGISNYHALTAKLEKRFSSGVQYLMSYTWGHAITDSNQPLAGGPGRRDQHNQRLDYSNAAFDVRHRWVLSGLWELPFGRGKKYGGDMSRGLDMLVGGWQLNGITQLQTGQPFSIGTNTGQCGCAGAIRPDIKTDVDPNAAPSGGRTPEQWFDTSNFLPATPGTWGALGHMSNFRPPLQTVDLSVFKDFPINERYRLQFRAEAFNLLNTPQFSAPNSGHGGGAFGAINSTIATPRQMQFALRFMF